MYQEQLPKNELLIMICFFLSIHYALAPNLKCNGFFCLNLTTIPGEDTEDTEMADGIS